MASQAPTNLPLLYNQVEPLNREAHGDKVLRRLEGIAAVGHTHAIPVTVDEFMLSSRHYPVIFSSGDAPVPLALMGLHEGTNTFFDEAGLLLDSNVYVPAYVRRYPFLLARLSEGSDVLSLCFDPTSGAIADSGEGEKIFDGDAPSPAVTEILGFCEQFEQAGQRTAAFMQQLKDLNLLMEGEVAIQPDGAEQPFVYRGFQMIDEAKFRDLRGDELRKMNQNGTLALIMAHLFSLSLMRDIFARQVAQGTGPAGVGVRAEATAEA